MNKKIIITTPDFKQDYTDLIERYGKLGYDIEWKSGIKHEAEDIVRHTKGYHAAIAGGEPWSREVIEGVKDTLKIIARHGVGFDKVDIDAATKAGIAVTNTPGAMSRAVAEHALSFMLCLTRQILKFDSALREGRWKMTVTRELTGKTVGLIGFGSISKELAKLLKSFNSTIVAYDVVKDQKGADELGVKFMELDELLGASDFVSIHIPLNGNTKGMVDEAFLEKMKSTAFLINTSRGPIIKEKALIEALQKGRIAGAGLDAFEVQPLPTDSPLLKMDNVVVSPLVASATKEAMDNMVEGCMGNITDFFSGRKPRNLLNPDYIKHLKQD